jgi:hypothetical protein
MPHGKISQHFCEKSKNILKNITERAEKIAPGIVLSFPAGILMGHSFRSGGKSYSLRKKYIDFDIESW